jgi:uncharacterized SAM-binding protein YcdF (DUF218 family)
MTSHTQSLVATSIMDGTEPLGWGWAAQVAPFMPNRRSRLVRGFFAALYLGVALGMIGFIGFLGFVYSLDRFERRPETGADGIVVLTGGAQRIDDAIDLLADGYADRLLISGVNEKTNRDQISRLNPGQRHLFDCCVDLDYRARNTIGNAIEIRRWTERNHFASLIVVTSNYHMPRALVELEHAFPNVQKIPYSVSATIDPHSWWRSASTARVLGSEYVKFLAVWIRTKFERDPEHSKAAKIMSGGSPLLVVAEPLAN